MQLTFCIDSKQQGGSELLRGIEVFDFEWLLTASVVVEFFKGFVTIAELNEDHPIF